jgi:hypothetical protein
MKYNTRDLMQSILKEVGDTSPRLSKTTQVVEEPSHTYIISAGTVNVYINHRQPRRLLAPPRPFPEAAEV